MKKVLFFLMAIIFAIQGFGQTVQTSFGTTTQVQIPINTNWGYTYSQQIVTNAELIAGGLGTTYGQITKIRWFWDGSGGFLNCNDWKIYIGHTTKTSFTSSTDWVPLTGLTLVFDGLLAAPVAAGWFEFTLQTPFTYNGTDNIVIAVDENTPAYTLLSNYLSQTASDIRGIYYRSDSTNPDPASPPTATGTTAIIPNIQLYFLETCPGPGNFTSSAVTHENATVSWTPNGTETLWNLEYKISTDLTWTTVTGLTTPTYTFNSLLPSVTYNVRVQANCGTDQSAFILPISFTTLASAPTTLPYTSDFENPTENLNWGFINGTQTNQWVIGNASNNPAVNNTVGGENALHISNDTGLSWAYTLATSTTPSRVYAYRDFSIDLGVTEIKLNLDWIANGNGYGDFLRVYWVPASTVITPGVIPPGSLDVSAALGTFYNNTNNNVHLQQASTWQQNEFIINTTQFPTLGGNTWRLLIHWRNESTAAAVQPPATVDNISIVVVACATPTALTASNPTVNSVDLAWTDNGSAPSFNIQYKKSSQTTWTTEQATSSPYTVSNLDPSSMYQFKVQADCGSEQSFYTNTISQATACAPITTLPWEEGFEGITADNQLPPCWAATSLGTHNVTQIVNQSYNNRFARTGTKSASFYYYPNGSNDRFFTVGIQLSAGVSYDFSFWYITDGISGWNTLQSGVYSAQSTDSLIQNIATVSSPNNTSYQKLLGAFTPTVDGVYYFGVYCQSTTAPNYLTIDDFKISESPSCLGPTTAVANNITPTSADVVFSPFDATTTNFKIFWKESTATTWNQNDIYGDTTYLLTTLTPNTIYNVKIAADCNDATYSETTEFNFRTACVDIATLPYSENFDTYGTGSYINYPSCWTRLSNYSGGSSYPYISSTNFSTPGSLYLYCYNNTYSLAAIHEIDQTLNVNQLKLNFKMYSYSTSYNLKVGVMTNPLDKNTFVQMGPNIFVNSTSVWEDKEIVLSSYSGLGRNIAFLVEDVLGSSNYCYIDNVVIDLLPPCPNVYNFSTDVVSTTAFSTNWDSSTDDGSGYLLSYAVSPTTLPFDPTTGTQVTIPTGTTLPYTISSLNPGDTIYVAVQAGCGGNWTTTQSVILPTLVSTVPYACNFEDTTQNATWTIQNGTQTNKWYIGAPGANGGTGNGLYISSDNGVTASYNNTATSRVMTSTFIQFNNSPEFALSFDWAAYGDGWGDYIIAYLVPLSYNITPGVLIPEAYRITPNLLYSATWQTRNLVLGSQYSNTVKRLVFLWYNDSYSGSTPPGLIDNVIINPLSCSSPYNLVASNIGTTTADLTWANSPTGAEFLVEYKLASATTWDQATTIDSTYQLTLLPSLTYNARIRAVCTPGDTSFASNMVTFNTLCVPFSPPTAAEPFLTMLPNNCWERKSGLLPATGNATLTAITSGWGIRTNIAPNTAYVNMYSTSCQYWLISPSIDLGDGSVQYQMDFDLARTAYYSTTIGNMDLSPNARFVVLISTDNGTTWNSTGILKDWNNSTGTPFSTLTNTLQTQTIGLFDPISLSPYTGIVKFAFFAYENDGDGTYDNDIHIDNFQVNPYNACVTPMDIVFSAVTNTTATASWDFNPTAVSYEVVYGLPGVDPATATPVSVTDTFYVMTPLTATTLYHFYVRSVCAGGEFSEWTSLRTFSTATLAPVPYTEPFATATVPVGYTLTEFSVGSQTYVPGNPASNIYYNVDSYPGSGKFSTINIGPLLPNYELAFEYKLALYSGGGVVPTGTGHFIVAISTDWGNTYTNVDTVDNNGLAGYQPYSLDLSAYDTEIIKIKITANWISNDYWIGIDNIYVGPAITCPYPNALVASNPTTTSIDLTWTENGTAISWEVQYGAPGFTLGTGTSLIANANNPFTVPSLTPSTTYDFYVRAVCGVGDSSMWSQKATMTTACLAQTLPLIEGFESSTNIPTCWTTTTTAANYTVIATAGIYPTCTAHGGSNMLYYNSYNISSGNHAMLYSPLLNVTGAAIQVSYWQYRDPGYSGVDYSTEGVEVFYNTTASTTGATSLGFTSRYFVTAGWYNINYTIPAGLTGNAYIMFKTTSELGNNQYIDDISLTYAVPACAVPTNLAISAINTTNATATWNEAGTATSWELAYKATAASTWTSLLVNTTPSQLISSLTAGTPYDVKVRAICAPGDTSAWATVVNFTTSTVSCNTPTNLAAGSITNSGATITWTAGGTETSWEVDYKLATATTWTTVTTTVASKVLTGLATCSSYNVRVRAVCGVGIFSSYTTVVNFNTLSPVPTNLQVTNITDQAALATWTAGGTETSWQVEYKLVSSANWTTATVNGTPSHPLTGLQSNSLYEVRVKSLCSPNESVFTPSVQFTTLGMTFTINATAGLNGTITPSGTVTVNAGANQTFTFGPNTGYVVNVVNVDGTPIVGTPLSYTFTNIMANHTINVEFTVGIEENELAQLVELFPNPTTSIIELRLKSDELHVTECKVFDMYGKLMRVIPINAETTSIDVTDFASGVYFVRMDSERGTISKKFVKK